MPAKNCPGKFGKKFSPTRNKLWEDFIKETGIDISKNQFLEIIWANNKNIATSIISESEGVQLPQGFGSIVVTKYKPTAEKRRKIIDYQNTKKLGKVIPLLNLHTFGYVYNIRWFKIGTNIKNLKFYGLEKTRPLKRGLAKAIKSGVSFFQWSASDLWNLTKLERRFNRIYKNND